MIEALTATAIVKFLSSKFAEKAAEKLSEEGLKKLNNLRELILQKVRGQAKLENALTQVEQGSESDIQPVATFLETAMNKDREFAQQVQTLAQEINQEINMEMPNAKNIQINSGGKNSQFNDNQGQIISGDGATVNIYNNLPKDWLNSSERDRTKLTPPYENLGQRGITEPERFVGRDRTLTELHQLLQQNTQVAIAAAVIGMGGVGKTELAIQYARQHLETIYTGGVCFLTGGSFILDLLQFARPRFFPNKDFTGFSEKEQLDYCWQHWADGKVLLIVDDVTNYKQQVKPYLPGNSQFKILITTREKISNVTPLNLEVLHPDDALKLLESIIGIERIEADAETAQQLCQWLGYLPLGLELVGQYLAEDEDISLAQMLQRLQQTQKS